MIVPSWRVVMLVQLDTRTGGLLHVCSARAFEEKNKERIAMSRNFRCIISCLWLYAMFNLFSKQHANGMYQRRFHSNLKPPLAALHTFLQRSLTRIQSNEIERASSLEPRNVLHIHCVAKGDDRPQMAKTHPIQLWWSLPKRRRMF